MGEEKQLTRRESIKKLSVLIGTLGFGVSGMTSVVSMGRAIQRDYVSEDISKRESIYTKNVKKGFLGGAISSWLIYYGTKRDRDIGEE